MLASFPLKLILGTKVLGLFICYERLENFLANRERYPQSRKDFLVQDFSHIFILLILNDMSLIMQNNSVIKYLTEYFCVHFFKR
jgi:hypothetical protein